LVYCTECFGRCNDDLPLVVGGGSVGRTVASEALDAFLVRRNLAGDGSLRSKARWVIDTRKTSFFVFLVESEVAYDAALVTRINDLGDLTIRGDVGRGRLLA
jgi:hypothetical protein